MNPYLERKRKELEEVDVAAPVPVAPSNPYLARQQEAPAQALDPVEQPMQPQDDRPVWSKILNLAPAVAMSVGHLQGKGTQETRGQMNRYLEQATAQNEADTQRAAASRSRATAYNNAIARRKMDRQRQKEQDTIAAEDRTRRIGAEDLAASRVADDYNPDSGKNMTLKQGIAQSFPEAWKKLTPEQQASVTVKNYHDVLGIPISEEQRKQSLTDDIRKEEEKQHSEYRWDTTKPTVFGGNNYFGGGGGRPPDLLAPANPDAENKFMQDMIAIYGSREKVPAVMATRANSGWEAATSGRMKDEAAIKLRDDLSSDANKDILATRADEHKQAAETAAAKKAESQQDNQYAVQRKVRGLDKLRANIEAVERELATAGKDIPGYGETGMFPDWAVSPKGVSVRQAVSKLGDAQIREATGAVANVNEEKKFDTILGTGKWNTDADLRAGLQKAKDYLAKQEAFLRGFYPDADERFNSRLKQQSSTQAPVQAEASKSPVIANGRIMLPDGSSAADTPNNRKALGIP